MNTATTTQIPTSTSWNLIAWSGVLVDTVTADTAEEAVEVWRRGEDVGDFWGRVEKVEKVVEPVKPVRNQKGVLSSVKSSSWISGIAYHEGFLVVFTCDNTAIIYNKVPSWLKGLVMAGMWKPQGVYDGKIKGYRSVGRAYCKLVKGKYASQVVRDQKEVETLRQMFD